MVFWTGRCLAIYDARYQSADCVSHKIISVYLTASIKHFQHTPTQLEYVSFSHIYSSSAPMPGLKDMFHVEHDDTLPLPACLSVCLSVFLSVCLLVCLPVFLSACLHVCMSACLSASLSVCLPVFLSVCLPVCLSACLPVFLSACLVLLFQI